VLAASIIREMTVMGLAALTSLYCFQKLKQLRYIDALTIATAHFTKKQNVDSIYLYASTFISAAVTEF
jgi:hypothetical protein